MLKLLKFPFPSVTIAAVLMALLVSQAASSVCAVQCAGHPAMEHCHAMSHGCPDAMKGCLSSGICTVDLLVSKQQENTASAGIQIDFRSDFVLPASLPAFFTRVARSSVSPPPLLTSLRI
jgi:hypothetical protein